MKRAGISLDEAFSKSEKDPKWAAAYDKAGIKVRMAIQTAKARRKARMTRASSQFGQKLITGLKEAVEHARGAKTLHTSTRRRAAHQRDPNR